MNSKSVFLCLGMALSLFITAMSMQITFDRCEQQTNGAACHARFAWNTGLTVFP